MFVTVCFIAVAEDYSSVNDIRIGEFNVTIPLPMNSKLQFHDINDKIKGIISLA